MSLSNKINLQKWLLELIHPILDLDKTLRCKLEYWVKGKIIHAIYFLDFISLTLIGTFKKLVFPLSSKDNICRRIVGSFLSHFFQNIMIGTSNHPQPALVNLNGALLKITWSVPNDFSSSFTTTLSIHLRSLKDESKDFIKTDHLCFLR